MQKKDPFTSLHNIKENLPHWRSLKFCGMVHWIVCMFQTRDPLIRVTQKGTVYTILHVYPPNPNPLMLNAKQGSMWYHCITSLVWRGQNTRLNVYTFNNLMSYLFSSLRLSDVYRLQHLILHIHGVNGIKASTKF